MGPRGSSRPRPIPKAGGILIAALMVAAVQATSPPAHAATARPNLVAGQMAALASIVFLGAQLPIDESTHNIGTGPAGSSATRLFLIANPAKPLEAMPLVGGVRHVASLGPGKSSEGRTTTHVPKWVTPGTYRVQACADAFDEVVESSELDNCRISSATVEVKASPGTDSVIDSFSDSSPIFTPKVTAQHLLQVKAQYCSNQPPISGSLTFAQALRSARSWLATNVGATAVAHFQSSALVHTVKEAVSTAVAAMTDHAPAAALDALLVAHGLQPADGNILISAAGLLDQLGLAKEAIAFVDQGDQQNPPLISAMGMNYRAVSLTNRGVALLALRRWSEARLMLQAAVDLDPYLSEAKLALAEAFLCGGSASGVQEAAKEVDQGERRSPSGDVSRTVTNPEDPTSSSYAPEDVLDLSRGISGQKFPELILPSSVQDAQSHAALYSSIYQDGKQRWQDLSGQASDLFTQYLSGPWAHATEATRDRVDSMLTYTDPAYMPDFDSLIKARADAAQAVDDVYADWEFGSDHGCAAATSLNGQWVSAMDTFVTAEGNYASAWYRYETAIAANFADPLLHQSQVLSAESEFQAEYNRLQAKAWLWTSIIADYQPCQGDGTGDPPQDTQTAPPPGEACRGAAKILRARLPLFDAGGVKGELKVNCEEFSFEVEGATDVPGIKAFAEVGHSFKTGQTTAYVGVKAGLDLGPFSGSFKNGVAIVSDENGLKDVVWRFGPSAEVSDDFFKIPIYDDEIKISFVDTVSWVRQSFSPGAEVAASLH